MSHIVYFDGPLERVLTEVPVEQRPTQVNVRFSGFLLGYDVDEGGCARLDDQSRSAWDAMSDDQREMLRRTARNPANLKRLLEASNP